MSAPIEPRAHQTLQIVDVCGRLHTALLESDGPAESPRFTTLRAPDRRPHPSCARSLLLRLDARTRTTGVRVLAAERTDAPTYAAPLAVADALALRGAAGCALTLRLVEDLDDDAACEDAAQVAVAVRDAFFAALERTRGALEVLCGEGFALLREANGGGCVTAARLECGVHVWLAALLAAGARADCDAVPLDVDATLRELLSDAVIDARAEGCVEFPLSAFRGVVSSAR